MKFTKLALTLVCTAVLFCGCAKNSDVVLKINDKELTRAEFYNDFNKIKNVQLKTAPKELQREDSYAVLALKDRYTNDVIVRELLSQEFERRKIEATDDEIKAKKEQIIAQIGSEEDFNKILKQNNVSQERLKKDLGNEVKMDKLVEKLGAGKISDSEVEKFYKQNRAQFAMPERVKVAHILIDTNPETIKRKIADADKDAKLSTADIEAKVKEETAKMEALAKEVREKAAQNPKEFAKLAQEYSQDEASATNGGDLGFITKDSVVPEFGNQAFKQKVGTVSPLVKSQFGYHIIYVTDRAASGVQPFSAVKADLVQYISQQKKVEAVQKLITGLKNSAKIEYVDTSLEPNNLRKQLEEALPRQLEYEQNQGAPKSKLKILEKLKKDKQENETK